MTETEIKEYIRSLVNEETAKFWTSTDILNYLKVAYTVVQAEFHTYLQEKDKTYIDLATDSSTDLVIPPANYHKIVRLEEGTNGQTLRYISDNEYWKYANWSAGPPVAWMWKNKKIKLIPAPSSTNATFGRIWYTTKKNQISDFPDCLHPLLAIEAVIAAKVKDENVSMDLIDLRRRFEMIAYMDLTFDQMQEPIIFGDTALEDSYT